MIPMRTIMLTRVAPAIEEMIMRNKAFRRHQIYRHMWRRLKEDRNQHYDDLDCACWTDPKAMAKFKEQPQQCMKPCCNRRRKHEGLTIQERRNRGEF